MTQPARATNSKGFYDHMVLRSEEAMKKSNRALKSFEANLGKDGKSLVVRGVLGHTHLEYEKLTIKEIFLRLFGKGAASALPICHELVQEMRWTKPLVEKINSANSGLFGLGKVNPDMTPTRDPIDRIVVQVNARKVLDDIGIPYNAISTTSTYVIAGICLDRTFSTILQRSDGFVSMENRAIGPTS